MSSCTNGIWGGQREADIVSSAFIDLVGVEQWPIPCYATPLHGWKYTDTVATSAGPATNDVYGRLYHHILLQLKAFRKQVGTTTTTFDFYNISATDIPSVLEQASFDRIDVRTAPMGTESLSKR